MLRTASCRMTPRGGSGPRPRSTGSGTAEAAASFRACPRSQQPRFFGARDVGGEPLARLTPLDVTPEPPLAVVGGLGLGHLVTPELAPERRLDAEVAAQVDLEALHHLTGVVAHHRSLESDVGGLEPGAAVGAAVDVDRYGLVEVRETLLQLAVEVLGVLLGLDDRQLAELEPGAGHRAAAECAGPHLQVGSGELGHELLDLLVRHVENDKLLLRGCPDPPGAVAVGEFGDAGEQGAADPAGAQREAECVGAVLL